MESISRQLHFVYVVFFFHLFFSWLLIDVLLFDKNDWCHRWLVAQYTAADTSWGSTATICAPKSSRARERCRCGVEGPFRRGTASYRASSSSPCPAPTNSPGQCSEYFITLHINVLLIFIKQLFRNVTSDIYERMLLARYYDLTSIRTRAVKINVVN